MQQSDMLCWISRLTLLVVRQRSFNTGKTYPALPPVLTHTGELFDYSHGDMSRVHPTVLSILEVSRFAKRADARATVTDSCT